jgi:hypothetical protein
MFIKLRKRYFHLTFVGFDPKGNAIIQEASVCCRKITEDIIIEARNWACRMVKKDGVNVENMCLINSLELDKRPEPQKGDTE